MCLGVYLIVVLRRYLISLETLGSERFNMSRDQRVWDCFDDVCCVGDAHTYTDTNQS